jgi:hypothetical protein
MMHNYQNSRRTAGGGSFSQLHFHSFGGSRLKTEKSLQKPLLSITSMSHMKQEKIPNNKIIKDK